MIKLEGVHKTSDESYEFCRTMDVPTDLIFLSKRTSGKKEVNGLEYFYAYEFNSNVSKSDIDEFRRALKNKLNDSDIFNIEDIYYFIQRGLNELNEYVNLLNFKVIVMPDSSKEYSLLNMIDSQLEDYVDGDFTTIKMIKNLCKDVIFDRESAKQALLKTTKYGNNERKLERALDNIERDFNHHKGKNTVFKMKLYSPVVARVGFTNIFKFKNPEQKELYRTLEQGTKVLLCDDFITSGSTVSQIKDVLDSINPNNEITIFILINQLKTY